MTAMCAFPRLSDNKNIQSTGLVYGAHNPEIGSLNLPLYHQKLLEGVFSVSVIIYSFISSLTQLFGTISSKV
jgi:hypothetical protein